MTQTIKMPDSNDLAEEMLSVGMSNHQPITQNMPLRRRQMVIGASVVILVSGIATLIYVMSRSTHAAPRENCENNSAGQLVMLAANESNATMSHIGVLPCDQAACNTEAVLRFYQPLMELIAKGFLENPAFINITQACLALLNNNFTVPVCDSVARNDASHAVNFFRQLANAACERNLNPFEAMPPPLENGARVRIERSVRFS